MKKIMKFKSLKSDSKAVAGIMVAVLLVGLFFSIIAFIQSVYVPQWMSDKESENMDDILDQFSSLKSSVDLLILTGQKQNPVSTRIKIGTKELPFLFSQRSFGNLDLLPNGFSINVSYLEGGSLDYHVFNLGSLKYSSLNNYYIQKSCIYENGAVILSQSSGEALIMDPDISVSDQKMTLNLVGLCGFQNYSSLSGYGTYPIKTEFSFNDIWFYQTVKSINFTTSNSKTWKKLINDSLKDTTLDYYNGDYEIIDYSDGFGIIFHVDGFSADVEINYIKTKVTPGWTI